mgnify:CR=1 FL=1
MTKILDSFQRCPSCNSIQRRNSKAGYLNRYSEQISEYFGVNEKKLNSSVGNFTCLNCRLIYKKKWFKKRYLDIVFNSIVPVHPKGWDKLSKKFNKKNFRNLIDKFIKNLNNKENKDINRYEREVLSFLDSMDNKNNFLTIKNKLRVNLKRKNKEKIKFYSSHVAKKISKPVEFSRFKGFESEDLIKYVESKIGSISSYSEIGCPLWGNLNSLSKKKIDCSFISGESFEFWGKNCKKNNKKCLTKLNKKVKKLRDLSSVNSKVKKDFIGVFLYLDHVRNPMKFFKNIFKNYKSCGIILEDSKKGVPIQHFTGWSESAFANLSRRFGKNFDTSFKKLKNTGKSFYLMY